MLTLLGLRQVSSRLVAAPHHTCATLATLAMLNLPTLPTLLAILTGELLPGSGAARALRAGALGHPEVAGSVGC